MKNISNNMTMKWIYIILVLVPVHSQYNNYTGTPENVQNSPCTDQNHYFLAPGVLTAGGTNRACVSRFYPEGSARMLLTLVAEDKLTHTASRDLPPGDGGCLDISVPLLPNTNADLIVRLWYKESQCSWERKVPVRIGAGRVVGVHCERARYRPGETVRARVYALKADLTPAPGNIEEIWIEGPPGAWEGTRVAQWTHVRSKLGLAQVQHDIDQLAPPGRWTVRARLADGSQGSAVFWVGNYELPPFQLTVRHASKVLRTSERLVWTVCVRYPWTEAVEGMLVIRLRAQSASAVTGANNGVRTAVVLKGRACHRHAAAAARVGLNTAAVVVAHFSFQEQGTRVWQNTTVVSQVVDKPISIEFLTKPRTVISPALPYKLKVKAIRWDDKPATNVRIIVCRSTEDDKHTNCLSGDTDTTGVARVMFAAGDDGNKYYKFMAHLSNDSSTSTGPLTLSTRAGSIQAALGPLRADPRGSRTFVPLYLSLHNVSAPVTVHFVVITRGGIIYRWGATTQCPIANLATHIQTATRNTICNDPMPQYDQDNEKSTNNNHKIDNNVNRNDKNRNHDENSVNIDGKRSEYNKNGRSYDSNTNQYYNDKERNPNSEYIIRNMNEFDINSYLHRNAHDKNTSVFDKNTTFFDRYTSVFVKNNVFEKTNDVNSIQYEINASDALLDRHLLRVMLPIKVTQQMCPDSHLIAYFYYNGEFVSASKHFEMDDCFVNKVEATFLPRQTVPGSPATLHLSTPGPALCALTALDSAAKWGPYNVKEALMQALKKMIDGHRNLTEYDVDGDCMEEDRGPASNSQQLTSSWLAAAGVRTGDTVGRSCDSPAAFTDAAPPRTDFSEAWLWRLVAVTTSGTATVTATVPDSITRYEANAVCLSKTGIAISQPAVLQVFREFFIHADCPKRLRRGDSAIARYRIFNYLYEPLSVQVQIIPSPHIETPPEVTTVCVPPRSSAARRVPLTGGGEGRGALTVRATAASDGGCGNTTTRGRGASDEVVMKITVEPEGMPVQEQKSILLCGKDEANSKSEVNWSWSPSQPVPGTQTLNVWVTGDLLGPLLADSDGLLQIPRGCGEQNMARLATNLLALQHLHPHSSAALVAREHVARGFTRQLQYIHPSGGFSAFGASDHSASTWLTAFSLKYMRKAHKVLWPDQPSPPALDKAESWLIAQQMENGCFRNEGQVFHRELRGGINEEGELASIALTAYVTTSLLSSPSPFPSPSPSPSSLSPLPPTIIRNALSCLRATPPNKYKSGVRVYTHALLAYAFMMLKNYEDDLKRYNEAKYEELKSGKFENIRGGDTKVGLKENEGLLEIMELIKMAKTDGDYMWWETSSLSTSIEATSYAVLALQCSAPALREWGAGAVRWLGGHRGATGGFLATQDTLIALEALSAWSAQQRAANLSLSISSGSYSSTRTVSAARIPDLIQLGDRKDLHITVEGTGCALVQATLGYRTVKGGPPRGGVGGGGGVLRVALSVLTDGKFDCDVTTDSCYCAAIIEVCAIWRGSFPEMALLEVSLPGGYGADAQKLYSQLQQTDSMIRRIELSPEGSRATLYLSPASPSPRGGHACYRIHAVGASGYTRPAYVTLLDYYRPHNNDTQFYTIPEDCPSRVTHDTSQDLTSDNIYNKARSLSDDGEILITHEFSFEDIPEGIPLEDPLYDNLKEKADLLMNSTNPKGNEKNELVEDDSNAIKDRIDEVNKKLRDNDTVRHGVTIDDKLYTDFMVPENNNTDSIVNNVSLKSNANNKSHRSEKILNINVATPYISKDLEDKTNTNQKEVDNTHANIKENNNINITTTKTPDTTDINEEKVHTNNKVDNPNLSDFHVIDSEKDLEVPSGIEGPIAVMVLPPQNFVPPNYAQEENDYGPTENFAKSPNVESTQYFGTKHTSQGTLTSENFDPTQNFEAINFGTTQNIQSTENLRATQNNMNPTQNFVTSQNNRITQNLQSNEQANYIRPTENVRRTQSYNPTQNFVTTQNLKYLPPEFFGATQNFRYAQNRPTENIGATVFYPQTHQNLANEDSGLQYGYTNPNSYQSPYYSKRPRRNLLTG